MKLELLISVSAETVDIQRKSLVAVEKFSTRIFDGDSTITSDSILSFLNKIKADKNRVDGKGNKQHEFELEWRPDEKNKSAFSGLKDSRPKDLSLFIYFFIRDDGKLASSRTGTATGARVMTVTGKGRGSNATQVLLIRSYGFDFLPK